MMNISSTIFAVSIVAPQMLARPVAVRIWAAKTIDERQ